MSSLFPVSGCKIFIGGQKSSQIADFVESDFDAVSWTEIDGYSQMGNIGDSSTLITTPLINRDRDVKQKGTKNAGSMQNVFATVANDPGQVALLAAVNSKRDYAVKVQFNDKPAARAFTVTISNASPGVVTKVAHALAANEKVIFTTTGALPTGLTASTEYYVKTVLDADTFTVSATKGGSAIVTSSAGSGTHTCTTVPEDTKKIFVALVMGAQEAGGAANTIRQFNSTFEINSNIVTVGAKPVSDAAA